MSKKEVINTVQLDGLTVLKIIQHCTENVPEVVTGQLLGLDVVERLEVTNCFPFPSDEQSDGGNDCEPPSPSPPNHHSSESRLLGACPPMSRRSLHAVRPPALPTNRS